MARQTFFSFHFANDHWRAGQVRNAGVVEGNAPVSDNKWEEIKRGGDAAIRTWIDGQLAGRSCVIVLIGSETAGRRWIKYEIEKGWNDGKGVVGVHIHGLKNSKGLTATIGRNPFDDFTMKRDNSKLSSIVKTYNPAGSTSTAIYDSIKVNLATWVEEAISIREQY